MEVRTLEQVKIFKLILNPIPANTEKGNIMAIAYDKQLLIDWMKDQKADEPWDDGRWRKTFKKGSALEMYNPPSDMDDCDVEKSSFGHGIDSEWTTEESIVGYINYCSNSYGMEAIPEFIKK